MFETWLSEHGHEDEVNVAKPAQNVVKLLQTKCGYHTVGPRCGAVEPLSHILGSDHVQGLLTTFAYTHCDNPNFRMWSTYMNMVEILLDFVRAERDGNWTLHLEAFAAMLPWLTIYDHTNYARWEPVYLADMKLLEMTAPEVYAEFMQGNFVVKRTKRQSQPSSH